MPVGQARRCRETTAMCVATWNEERATQMWGESINRSSGSEDHHAFGFVYEYCDDMYEVDMNAGIKGDRSFCNSLHVSRSESRAILERLD